MADDTHTAGSPWPDDYENQPRAMGKHTDKAARLRSLEDGRMVHFALAADGRWTRLPGELAPARLWR